MIFEKNQPADDMDYIELKCPYCDIGVDFLSNLAGTAHGCPNCGQSLLIPRQNGQVGGKIPLPMEATHLILRRFVLDDWKGLMAYWQDTNDDTLCHWLNAQLSDNLTDEGKEISLGIERKKDSQLIGNFTFQYTDLNHSQAIFQVVVNDALMTPALFREACLTLFVLCFSSLNLHRLSIQIPAEDEKLHEQLLVAGMRKEGEFRKDFFNMGHWHDTLQFALLQEEYKVRVGL